VSIAKTATWTERPQRRKRFFRGVQSGSAVFPQYESFEVESIPEPEEIIGGSVIFLHTATGIGGVQEQGTSFSRLPTEAESRAEEFREMPEFHFVTVLDSSTLPQDYPDEIDQEIELLFDRAKEEVFEDGMESEFSRGLISYIRRYGNAAIATLERLIVTEQVNAEVASEAMRWLGHIDHPITYRSRLHLLERSLHNSSARVRDGAGLGLASLDDPHAIPYLKQAIEREQYQELRHDLKQVVIQLESTYI
jgi:hypothetical protein